MLMISSNLQKKSFDESMNVVHFNLILCCFLKGVLLSCLKNKTEKLAGMF